MRVEWHKLGELIEDYCCKCGNGNVVVSGVDINKQFIETRANLQDTDVSKYYVVPPNGFACNLMHIGRDERLPIAFNSFDAQLVVTSAYYVFTLKDAVQGLILKDYLYMYLSRKETDRLTWFYTDSSVRGNLRVSRFKDIEIPVPPITEQRKVVEAWQGLRKMKEENEQLAEPLLALCRSYLQEIKKKCGYVSLGDYIERCEDRNGDGKFGEECLLGVNNQHEFCPTRASTQGVDMRQYQVVRKNEFVYNPARLDIGSIGLFNGDVCIVSTLYEVFRIKSCHKNELLSEFLMLWFERSEFIRYVGFANWGSAREYFWLDAMCRVKIPLPPIEVQQAVVDLYRCANEAKKIAAEADRLSREICPALIQRVVKEVA